MHAFSRNDNDHFEPDQSSCKTGTEVAHLGGLIGDVLGTVREDMIPEMGFGMTIGQGILSVFSSIFSKVDDYRIESIFSKVDDYRIESFFSKVDDYRIESIFSKVDDYRIESIFSKVDDDRIESIFSKADDEKIKHCMLTRKREKGSSLSFNLTSLASPVADTNLANYYLLHSSSSEEEKMLCVMFQLIATFRDWQNH